MQYGSLLTACSQHCAYLQAETREKMTSTWNHEDNLWVQDVFINKPCLNVKRLTWQLKNRKQIQPAPRRANNIPRLLQRRKSFYQLQWGLAQAPGNKTFLMFFHALWWFFCLFICFSSFCLLGALCPLPLTESHVGFYATKHLSPPLQQRQLKKQLLTKENTSISCLLRMCWRLVYKSFCCFWLRLKCHLKLPSLVLNPFSLIAFRLRRAY